MSTASRVSAAVPDAKACRNPLQPTAESQKRTPIEIIVQFSAPQSHYVDIAATYPSDGHAELELMMPVWTPGSYMVREYARNIESVSAFTASGEALPIVKTQKNRWRVTTQGQPSVLVRYRVYGREMTVRNNWIEADFALLNGAATFMTVVGDSERPHDVRVVPAKGWKQTITGLPIHPDSSSLHFRAPNFDVLVDSPIASGNLLVQQFEASGKKHVLATQGGDAVWDAERAVRDVEQIVKTEHAFWKVIPYQQFTFISILTEGGGGLEHGSSTVVMGSRWASRDREDYLSWLATVSHEFFHTWNIKRLRPIALGPFDYERENHTPSLWVAEGITSYYDDMFVQRAGLMTRDEYLKRMGKSIDQLQNQPGRRVQPMDVSSFDAWIKLYRPDENSANTTISYYTKGSIVAFLLDLEIRKASQDKKSLDDVMRVAYERYSGDCGYTEEQFRALISEVAGADMGPWIAKAVSSTEELDYASALAWVGLRFKPVSGPKKGEGAAANDPWVGIDTAFLGLDVKADNGRNVVSKVLRDTPAFAAGINVDDELLGIDGYRVRSGDLDKRLARYKAGTQVDVLVARRDKLIAIPVTLGKKPAVSWELEVDPDATPEVQSRRELWLAGQTQTQ